MHVTRSARSAALAALALLGAACAENRAAAPAASPAADDPVEFGSLPGFELVSQDGETVTLDSLRGRPFVVAAIFTTCSGPCPRITAHMRRLQDELADTDARLVSISVDPETDTPEVLAAYAAAYTADTERWFFLTGEEEEIHRLLREGMWLGVERAPPEDAVLGMQVTHATKLLAVDREGRRRGWYDGEDEGEVDRLRDRMRFLASRDD